MHPATFLTRLLLASCLICQADLSNAQPTGRLRPRDRKRDVLMTTTAGSIRLRLSDATPAHRDNFIRLVRSGFYEGVLFHRVIRGFMIQAGDARTRPVGAKGLGAVDSSYTIPAEFQPGLYHRRGSLAAARMGDAVNPAKASSGTQFYIVHGRSFTDQSLDSVETFRLQGRRIPAVHREVYLKEGGAPHLDQNYTVFGEVLLGMEVVDRIASVLTNGREGGDKPLEDVRIIQIRLVKRDRKAQSHF